jgi:predicted nuclease of predicted toxin-antitoxin system
LRFLIDTNLPPALREWLAVRGHDAVHAAQALSPQADDASIWAHAQATDAIVVTKDRDYLDLGERVGGARVVWVRCGNLKLVAFEDWIRSRWPAVEELLALGEAVIEVR